MHAPLITSFSPLKPAIVLLSIDRIYPLHCRLHMHSSQASAQSCHCTPVCPQCSNNGVQHHLSATNIHAINVQLTWQGSSDWRWQYDNKMRGTSWDPPPPPTNSEVFATTGGLQMPCTNSTKHDPSLCLLPASQCVNTLDAQRLEAGAPYEVMASQCRSPYGLSSRPKASSAQHSV
jgi:hypothetical protein